MTTIKIAFNQLWNNKIRLIIFITSFSFLVFLFVFALFSINVNRINKLKEIEDLPKDLIFLHKSIYLENENLIKEKYNNVAYTTRSLMGMSQNIHVDVITPELIDIGLPVYHSANSSKYNIDRFDFLYVMDDIEIEDILNPIIIDNITSIKKFNRLNSLGEQIAINFDNNPIIFTVYGVIKETRERNDLKIFSKNHSSTDDVEPDSTGYSHAYIFESSFIEITGNKPLYDLMIIKTNSNFTNETLNELLNLIEIDSNDFPYYSGLDNNFLYTLRIEQEYYASFISNIIIIAIYGIIFLFIYINGIITSLSKNKLDISYFKTIGINKESIIKVQIYYWLIQILIGFIIGLILSSILIIFIYKWQFFTYINIFFKYSLYIIGLNLIILLLITIPSILIFISKVKNFSLRPEEEH